jgi:hypothetical protein
MEAKDIISLIALCVSFVSLFWVYFTNRRLEKYKAIVGLEKSYVESKLQQELRMIQELLLALRDGRLLIEKLIVRNRSAKKEEADEILDRLEEKYTQSLLFLEKTHATVENSSIVIFVHEQKNRVRNTIEELVSGEYSNASVNDRLNEIKDKENKLVDKLSDINNSLFDIYKNQLKV